MFVGPTPVRMLENNCLDINYKWIFFIKMANGIRTQNFRMPAERTTKLQLSHRPSW